MTKTQTHTHLDRQRRKRGDCPGCDAAWERQDAWLADRARPAAVERQLEQLSERPRSTESMVRWCVRILDEGSLTHSCQKRAGHEGRHLCGACPVAHAW